MQKEYMTGGNAIYIVLCKTIMVDNFSAVVNHRELCCGAKPIIKGDFAKSEFEDPGLDSP